MNRHPFRAICAVAASAFALLAVCGCAARPVEALNQALEALNAQQAGQFRILNLSEDGESLSVAVEYAFENGAPYFTHQGWDAEGVQSEYQYQNGKLILPEGELPETALDDTTQYRTLSEIAGVDLTPLQKGEIQAITCEPGENGSRVYTVEMKQTDVTEQAPYASVWGAQYRRYVVDSAGHVARVDVGSDGPYTMAVVFAP